jgi:signal transduction histidine kinase
MTGSPPAVMVAEQSIQVVILGAGKGGMALLELLTRCKGVDIVAVADSNPQAPGLRLAQALDVPTATDARSVIGRTGADLIIDVTGDPSMPALIAAHKAPEAEMLGGTAAKLLWSLIQDEQELYEHLAHTEKLSTLGVFAAGIAHEFNNPLHCMLGFAQLIQGTDDQHAIRDYTGEIVKLIAHLSGMTKSVNLYARGGSRGTAVSVQIPRLMDEAVKMATFSTILDEVAVKTDYKPVPDFTADPGELLQVFVNLIVNAVQAMNARGCLTLTTGTDDRSILVSIGDTGPGIAPQDLSRIFAPFFTTKERGQGSGLGLYIVQTLVKKYGGTIEAVSEPGDGTTFLIRFPLPGRP